MMYANVFKFPIKYFQRDFTFPNISILYSLFNSSLAGYYNYKSKQTMKFTTQRMGIILEKQNILSLLQNNNKPTHQLVFNPITYGVFDQR